MNAFAMVTSPSPQFKKLRPASLARLDGLSAWLDGDCIDAFMAWVINKDVPFFDGVIDDASAAYAFADSVTHGWEVGRAQGTHNANADLDTELNTALEYCICI